MSMLIVCKSNHERIIERLQENYVNAIDILIPLIERIIKPIGRLDGTNKEQKQTSKKTNQPTNPNHFTNRRIAWPARIGRCKKHPVEDLGWCHFPKKQSEYNTTFRICDISSDWKKKMKSYNQFIHKYCLINFQILLALKNTLTTIYIYGFFNENFPMIF